MKEELETKCRAQELSQVRCDRSDLRKYPHAQDDWSREMLAAQLGEIVASGNTELGREHLNEHGHQVACHNDPEQHITKACARLNIRREVARVDIGDTGDKRWAEERQEAANEPFLALPTEYLSGGAYSASITRFDFSWKSKKGF